MSIVSKYVYYYILLNILIEAECTPEMESPNMTIYFSPEMFIYGEALESYSLLKIQVYVWNALITFGCIYVSLRLDSAASLQTGSALFL